MIDIILSGFTPKQFLELWFFAIVGILISTLWDASTRKPWTEGSPVRFSFKFFINDNARKFYVSLLLVYVVFIFSNEVAGIAINKYYALIVGLSFDKLAILAKKKYSKVKKDIAGD